MVRGPRRGSSSCLTRLATLSLPPAPERSMADRGPKNYWLSFQLLGISELVSYRVSKDDWDRCGRFFDRFDELAEPDEDAFFMCDTRDGLTVAVAPRAVEFVRLLYDYHMHAEVIDPDEEIRIFFVARSTPFEELIGDPADVADLFQTLESGVDRFVQ